MLDVFACVVCIFLCDGVSLVICVFEFCVCVCLLLNVFVCCVRDLLCDVV